MIWEIYQQTKINQAKNTAQEAKTSADRQAYDIVSIHEKVDRLTLCCQAMWELLRDHSDLTEEHIDAKILEIDGRDGNIDGKISAQMIDCPACGRPTNTRRSMCVICGAPLSKIHKFDV